ncbi:MAG: BlaI/MecI/CopY family transcriptional regulator [Planctomycetaceae bacterium]
MSDRVAKPSDLELQVLSVLWERGPQTVRDILALLPDGKDRAYTTVLTILQGMSRKGFVTHTQDGPAHVYHPAVTRADVLHPMMRTLVQHAFGGDPSRVVQALLGSGDVSTDDLKEIRKLINRAVRDGQEDRS